MNSALTKVYAIGDSEDRLPIYDGRVGAALGILVVSYCRTKSIEEVPTELLFGFFDSQSPSKQGSRNPSRDRYAFKILGDDSFHANCMWRCRRVLEAVGR